MRRQKVTKLDLLARNEAVRNIFVSEGLRVVKKDFDFYDPSESSKKGLNGPYVLCITFVEYKFAVHIIISTQPSC